MSIQSKDLEDDKQTTSGDEEESYDQDLVTKSLGKVGKGAGILFIGTIFGIFLNFLARVVIARFYSPEDYGLFNLFFTVLSIFVAIGMLGLTNGIQRHIGYYIGSGEKEKIKAVEGWGLLIGLVSGTTFGAILFLLAPYIAPIFSEMPEFVTYLKIAALALPFYILLTALISIFRGHHRTKEKILFYDVGRNAVFLVLSFVVGLLTLPFIGVIWAMTIATAIMAICFFVYYLKKQKTILKDVGKFSFTPSIGKKILIFSLPLLLVDIMYRVLGWADTMMIGYFITESAVGFYNVARPLSSFVSTGLLISTFIYSPLAAGLYAQQKFKENDIIFSVLTKWVCFLTLPFAMVLFIYSDVIITLFFGANYLPAVIPLKILVIVYFASNILGPNAPTLIAYGKTRFLMYVTSISAGLNLVLNYILIPKYALIGAAIATGISIIAINLVRTYKLYLISNIHPFKPQIIKPTFFTIILGIFVRLALSWTGLYGLLQILLSSTIFTFLFLAMMFVTKSISKDDLRLILLLENKLNLDLKRLKKVIKRFL